MFTRGITTHHRSRNRLPPLPGFKLLSGQFTITVHVNGIEPRRHTNGPEGGPQVIEVTTPAISSTTAEATEAYPPRLAVTYVSRKSTGRVSPTGKRRAPKDYKGPLIPTLNLRGHLSLKPIPCNLRMSADFLKGLFVQPVDARLQKR